MYEVSSLQSIKYVRVPGPGNKSVDNFLVRWGGLWNNPKHDTWEPPAHLEGCEDQLSVLIQKRKVVEEAAEVAMKRKADAARQTKEAGARAGMLGLYSLYVTVHVVLFPFEATPCTHINGFRKSHALDVLRFSHKFL